MTEPSVWRRILVVAPHPDDAALSLGATLAAAARAGAEATILTVFGGDADSGRAAGDWDALCGFKTEGGAARERAQEDRRASEVLGVRCVSLSHPDEQYARPRDPAQLLAELTPWVDRADAVLVPGFPLINPDHLWLHRLLVDGAPAGKLGLYVEQPYAADTLIGRRRSARPLINATQLARRTRLGSRSDPELPPGPGGAAGAWQWRSARARRPARVQKAQAIRAYGSQSAGLGRFLVSRIALYESIVGGEQIAAPRRTWARWDPGSR